MRGITINGHRYRAVYGGSLPAPIWRQVMQGALKGVPKEDFTAPTKLDNGTLVAVPDVRGLTTEAAVEQLRAVGFGVTVARPVDAYVPRGVIVLTNPGAGSRVPAGTYVTVYPSSGKAPPPVATATPTPQPTKPGNGPPPPPPSSPAPSPTPSPTKKGNH
jgi:membrane peptidoglycan carboxypeptidase